MAKIKVTSMCENSMEFNIYDNNVARRFIMDSETKEPKQVIESPVLKTVTVMGVHKYQESNKNIFIGNCAITEMDSKEWEAIQTVYAHNYYIKNKLIFSEKSEAEIIARVRDYGNDEIPTGTAKIKRTVGKVA